MKKFLLSVLICLPLLAKAQTDEKYLAGAIPVVDGKVSFTTEMQVPALSQEQLYDALLDWANTYFKPEGKLNARVLYTNKEEGTIAAGGEEYLVFTSSALSLDRTRIYYQLLMTCKPGKCDLEMTRIRYWYDEARDGGEKYVAEEWITDDMALNKSKTKLAPICGKFRRKTIDLKDELFKSIQSSLGNRMIALGLQPAPVTPTPAVTVATPGVTVTQSNTANIQPTAPVAPTAPIAPVAPVAPTAPTTQNIDAQIQAAVRMTITAGNDEQFEIGKECWGGFGKLFGKDVAFCLIDTQKTMGNMLLSQSDSYTVSFYMQGNNKPSVVVKCKKLMQQNITGEEAKKMNPNNDGQKTYNMYVGEIIKSSLPK